jgi:peptidoglycan/xylan/chitin deacetylase (PgdA/CDA1 family)
MRRGRGRAAFRDETLQSDIGFLASLRLELAYLSGVPWLWGRGAGGAGVVLRFERVRPRRATQFQPLKSREITPKFLDRTIRALKRWKFDIVSMDEACRRAVTWTSRPRFVCLTFDGGYKDLVTAAYPVLSRHGVPFTVYVPTAFPDGVGEAWWLALEEVIARENRIGLVMDRTERHFNIGNTFEKYQLYQYLENWMRSLAPTEVSSAINDLCRRYTVDLMALSREASMDWNDLAKLAVDPLVTIGSATVNYPEGRGCAARDDDGEGGRAGRVSTRRQAFRLSVR